MKFFIIFLLFLIPSNLYAKDNLSGTSWIQSGLDVNGKRRGYTLNFEKNRVFGNDSCNNYNGKYVSDDNSLSFGENFASTKRACQNNYAAEFYEILQKIKSYSKNDKFLYLKDSQNSVLTVFRRAKPRINGEWEVVLYNDGKNYMSSLLKGTTITSTIDKNQIGGKMSCNDYGASYTLGDKTIQIRKIFSSLKACERASLEKQDEIFLKALNNSKFYKLNGSTLELRDENGFLQLLLKK